MGTNLNDGGCIRLVGAIIGQALKDANSRNKKTRRSAIQFLNSGEFVNYCQACGVSPSVIFSRAGLSRAKIQSLSEIEEKPNSIPFNKHPCDMTQNELKEYRATYRREYNKKNVEKRNAYNAKRREKRRLAKLNKEKPVALVLSQGESPSPR